jgi:hypothetical protein
LFFILGVSLSVSVLTLTAISVDRYYIIYKPMKARSICTDRKVKLTVILIWSLSIFLMSPLLYVLKYESIEIPPVNTQKSLSISICIEKWPHFESKLAHEVLLILFLFVFPCKLMSYAYIKISKTLWRVHHKAKASITNELSFQRAGENYSLIDSNGNNVNGSFKQESNFNKAHAKNSCHQCNSNKIGVRSELSDFTQKLRSESMAIREYTKKLDDIDNNSLMEFRLNTRNNQTLCYNNRKKMLNLFLLKRRFNERNAYSDSAINKQYDTNTGGKRSLHMNDCEDCNDDDDSVYRFACNQEKVNFKILEKTSPNSNNINLSLDKEAAYSLIEASSINEINNNNSNENYKVAYDGHRHSSKKSSKCCIILDNSSIYKRNLNKSNKRVQKNTLNMNGDSLPLSCFMNKIKIPNNAKSSTIQKTTKTRKTSLDLKESTNQMPLRKNYSYINTTTFNRSTNKASFQLYKMKGNELAINKLIRSRRRVVKLLIVLVLLFLLSWLPFNIINFSIDLMLYRKQSNTKLAHNSTNENNSGEQNTTMFLSSIYPFALCLALANSATNPVCYMALSHGFRKLLLNKIKNKIVCGFHEMH